MNITKETHITIKNFYGVYSRQFEVEVSRKTAAGIRLNTYNELKITEQSARRLLRVLRADEWKQGFDLENAELEGDRYLTYHPLPFKVWDWVEVTFGDPGWIGAQGRVHFIHKHIVEVGFSDILAPDDPAAHVRLYHVNQLRRVEAVMPQPDPNA